MALSGSVRKSLSHIKAGRNVVQHIPRMPGHLIAYRAFSGMNKPLLTVFQRLAFKTSSTHQSPGKRPSNEPVSLRWLLGESAERPNKGYNATRTYPPSKQLVVRHAQSPSAIGQKQTSDF